MTENSLKTVRLTLNNSPYCGKSTVSMEAFFDFSFEMAEQREDLVAQQTRQNLAEPRDRIPARRTDFIRRR